MLSPNALVALTFDAKFIRDAEAVVAKLNARALKAGITDQLTTTHSVTQVQRRSAALPDLPSAEYDVCTFVVLGEPLKLNGWEFIATLTWDAEAGCITRPVPGIVADLSQHRDATRCDHCQTNRRRNDTFVVRHDDGRQLQVGSSCLEAFLGLNPTRALFWVDIERTVNEAVGGFSGGGERRTPVETLLAFTAAASAIWGWTSRSKASELEKLSTVDLVLGALYPASGRFGDVDRERCAQIVAHLQGDQAGALARAQATLAYIRSDDFNGTSEYVRNLKALLAEGVTSVGTRNAALAASAVSCYVRHTDRARERAQAATTRVVSQHVGQVKERLRDLVLTVVAEPRFIDGEYGTSTLIIWADKAGNTFKWFASGTHDVEVGQVFTVTGTVKKHETYNGIASTVLSRCKTDPKIEG
jgi:hypothetical protein